MTVATQTKACAYCNMIFTYPELQQAKIIFDENKSLYFHPVCFRELFRFLKYVFDKEMTERNILYSDQVFIEEDFFGTRKLLLQAIKTTLLQYKKDDFKKKAKRIQPFWRMCLRYLHFQPEIPKKLLKEVKKLSQGP